MNITLIGMPGSGKSYIGKMVAEQLGYTFVELDALMEQRFGKPIQHILDMLGEKAFLAEQAKDAITHTKEAHNMVISPGGSLVYSDTAMQHLQTISRIVYLKTSLETIQKRINETPRGIVGLNNQTLEELYQTRAPLYEKWARVTINAEQNADVVVHDIVCAIR